MSDDARPLQIKKKWWSDLNIIIGTMGVIATILVGIITYYLTSGSVSREYHERIKAARNDAMTVISRSIGEGIVPNQEKVQSVLNSIRRQYNIAEVDFQTPVTVFEDLLARVLSNEFLDAKRREELSTKLLTLKMEMKNADLQEKKVSEVELGRLDSDRMAALVVALAAAFIAALSLTLMKERIKRTIIGEPGALREDQPIRDKSILGLGLLVLVMMASIVGIMSLLFVLFGKEYNITGFF